MVAGGLVVGAGAVTGQVAASHEDCLENGLNICWLDVKPNSCPNSVNADSNGTLPLTAGWPHFDPTTIVLIPVKAPDYDAKFDECQDWSDPEYHMDDETEAELERLAMESDRSAAATWYRVEDVDGDGDLDSKFKFDVADLEFESDDTHLILRGESSNEPPCTNFGIDSVRVVGGEKNGESEGDKSRGQDKDRR